MGRIISISTKKGGVGKTTTAINLAACLASAEHRTLLVDIDQQANASSGLGILPETVEKTVYDLLVDDAPIEEVIRPTELKYLDILPANEDLAGAELDLIGMEERERRLANVLNRVRDQYEYILIDCPPGLGLLTLNALLAADSVIIPLQCEYFALEGMGALMKTIEIVNTRMGHNLEIEGVLLTMHTKQTRLSEEVAAEARKHFGDKVFEAVIPRNIRLAECPSFGKPIILFDIRCPGSEAYLALARELHRRVSSSPQAAPAA